MLSETIRQRLIDRFASPLPDFHQRRIIFWRDEGREFADAIDELELPGIKILKLTGSNNYVAKKLLSSDDLENHYLVYDPLSYKSDQHDDWLLDIRLYSEEFRADLVSLQMEELLIEQAPVMRKAVRLYAKFFENKERKAKLRRLGRTYQTPLQLHVDILAVLCGINGERGFSPISFQDILIAVLSAGLEKDNNDPLNSIEKFGNLDVFWELIQHFSGFIEGDDRPLTDLASHILLTALSQALPPSALEGLERFVSKSNSTFCYQLVHEWQHGNDGNKLKSICRSVERNLRLAARFDRLESDQLLKSDIFPAINESLIKRFCTEIAERVIKVDEIIGTVENRRTAAWYNLSEDYFESLFFIAKMQEFYLSHIKGFNIVEPSRIWELYTKKGYEMDSYYRHFHLHFSKALKRPHTFLEDPIKKCSDVVEGLYHEWFLKQLNQAWTEAIATDLDTLGYVSEISEQRRFYLRYVSPNASKNSHVYVIISDALRYEVAVELTEQLGHSTRGQATLESMQAIFPSITKFGMAALLPGKEISVNEKLDVLVDGQATTGTAQREAILKATNQHSIAITYKKLLPLSKKGRRELVVGKEVVYIYHNVIDAFGDDRETEEKVFDGCQAAIEELTALVKIITNDLSGTNIFITADHGFLYTYKPLEESQKVSSHAFNGQIFELGRRHALTPPETSADYLLPVKTDTFIGGIPVKGYAPRDTVRIRKPGGGEKYVHGGMSLQEMVVPVIVYKAFRTGQKHYIEVQNPGLSLISESRKLSNLIFSLDFLQNEPVSEKVQPCHYSLYFVDEEGVPISDVQTVIADKTDKNASSRIFRVRFNLKPKQYDKSKLYRLRIVNQTDVPVEIEFHIDIAFADDFGFDL